MIKRVHIFGASGTGTTSLAKSISNKLKSSHFDTDDFFWIKTDPPFTNIRKRDERQKLLKQTLEKSNSWILSGSLCGWGDFAIPMFDLIVFLSVPTEIRLQRAIKREITRFGNEINHIDNIRYQTHKKFLNWTAEYDKGGLDMRSKATHEKWLSKIDVPIIRIDGTQPINKSTEAILQLIKSEN